MDGACWVCSLLPAFTHLGHERQDLLSPCDGGNGVWAHVNSKGKIPSTENIPRGGSNPRRCRQRAQALPTELFPPCKFLYTSLANQEALSWTYRGFPTRLVYLDYNHAWDTPFWSVTPDICPWLWRLYLCALYGIKFCSGQDFKWENRQNNGCFFVAIVFFSPSQAIQSVANVILWQQLLIALTPEFWRTVG